MQIDVLFAAVCFFLGVLLGKCHERRYWRSQIHDICRGVINGLIVAGKLEKKSDGQPLPES